MSPISDHIREFFEDYQRNHAQPDPHRIAAFYADSFLFAGPTGSQTVRKEDFLKALPRRAGYFKSVGLVSSKIQSLQETCLDGAYVQVKAVWAMTFAKDPAHPIVAETAATYILYQHENSLQIVFQLDHQDLAKTAQELGF